MIGPRQGRLVILLNGAVGVAVIAVVASLSLTRGDVAPPSQAELAPAGTRSLQDLETSQAPVVKPTPVRAAAERLAPPAGTVGLPRQLACYGWPDGSTTQTFDPQSPPCISGWDVARGNGGATSVGVTATTIRVGVPRAQLSAYRGYASFFGTHFQLYGRAIQVVGLDETDLVSPEGQQAAAEEAAEQQVFAVLVTPPATSGPAAVPTQLLDVAARQQLITVLTGSSQVSSTRLSALSPYAWSYSAGIDRVQQAAGSLVCQLLAGRKAVHSPEQKSHARRFALLLPDAAHAGGSDLDTGAVESALQGCHSPARVERVDPTSPSAVSEALVRLRRAGVTSLLPYLTARTLAGTVMPAAEQVGFHPEWVLTGIDDASAETDWEAAPDAQVRSLFGLASWSPPRASGARPAARAAIGGAVNESAYRGLLVLASGIQLAGPALDPDSFANGLAGAAFPDPGAGTAPLFSPSVGFDDGDHAMVDDVALAWWRYAMVVRLAARRRPGVVRRREGMRVMARSRAEEAFGATISGYAFGFVPLPLIATVWLLLSAREDSRSGSVSVLWALLLSIPAALVAGPWYCRRVLQQYGDPHASETAKAAVVMALPGLALQALALVPLLYIGWIGLVADVGLTAVVVPVMARQRVLAKLDQERAERRLQRKLRRT